MTSMWRPHEVASAEHILETLRPWLAERAGGRPALVRAFSAELRRAASAHLLDGAEIVLVDLLSCRPSTAWADAARTELGRHRAEEQEAAARAAKTSKPSPPRKKRRPQTIYAASDGSKHRRGSRFASAWVTSTGEFQVTNGRGSISEAELRAAISFLRWFHANRKSAKDRAVLFVDRMPYPRRSAARIAPHRAHTPSRAASLSRAFLMMVLSRMTSSHRQVNTPAFGGINRVQASCHWLIGKHPKHVRNGFRSCR